jgi:hypothetical protein
MKNNLEIMKIQYAADTRHGLTRDQEKAIKDLEHANLGIQIEEQQNQIDISTIQQNGLRDAQDALDKIREAHDEAMYEQQIRDLDKNIKDKNDLYATTVTAIAAADKAIEIAQANFRNNELTKTIKWAQNMNQWMQYAQGSGGPGNEQLENPLAASFASGWSAHINSEHHGVPSPMDIVLMGQGKAPIPGLDTGGTVLESGIAKVHKGEVFGQPGGGMSVNVQVIASLDRGEDVQEWGRKLGAGLASGFLSSTSSGMTTAVSRKTGLTINVPGTSVTTAGGTLRPNRAGTGVTTLPVVQPIQTKGRYRVG